jgi:hypothetical protein
LKLAAGSLAVLLAGAMVAAGVFAAPSEAGGRAGPVLAKCGKLKRGSGRMAPARKREALRRFRACLKQNRANRIAFAQIEGSRFVGAPEGFEIALRRRGSQWQYGVASLGRILEPGTVEKSDAKTACGSL